MKARCSETIMSPRGRCCDATKFNLVNLFKEHLAMETILAIDLGKRNRVFYKLNTSSLKSEYFTAKTDPQKFHDIFIELDIETSIVLFEVGTQAGWLSDMLRARDNKPWQYKTETTVLGS